MRARLSGLSGHKTVFETVYNYEEHAQEIDLENVLTFTPKEFLESVYRVKTYTVTGQVTGRTQEHLGSSTSVSGHPLGTAVISLSFDQRPFPMTSNGKPPQIQQPVSWYDGGFGGDTAMILYRDQHVAFQPSYAITERNCHGTTSVDTRYWNYSTQSPGDYGHTGNLSAFSGYRLLGAISCDWAKVFSTGFYSQNYFDKERGLYHILPPLAGSLIIDVPPTYASTRTNALSLLQTSLLPIGKKAGFYTYIGLDGNRQTVPIYTTPFPTYGELDVVSCDITVQATVAWDDSDF